MPIRISNVGSAAILAPTGPTGPTGNQVKIATVTVTDSSWTPTGGTTLAGLATGYLVLSGQGFTGATALSIGENSTHVAASSMTVISDSEIRAQITPTAAVGSHHLYLTGSNGSVTMKPNGVTVTGPILYASFDSNFNDESSFAHTLTNTGSTKIVVDTTVTKFGGGSMKSVSAVPGTNMLSYDISARSWQPSASGAWCLDFWIYIPSGVVSSGQSVHAIAIDPGTSTNIFSIRFYPADNAINLYSGSPEGGLIGASASGQTNAWYHTALVKNAGGTRVSLFWNGTRLGSFTNFSLIQGTASRLQINKTSSDAATTTFYIDNLKLRTDYSPIDAEATTYTVPTTA